MTNSLNDSLQVCILIREMRLLSGTRSDQQRLTNEVSRQLHSRVQKDGSKRAKTMLKDAQETIIPNLHLTERSRVYDTERCMIRRQNNKVS